jgi:hypothetical protein
VQPHDSFPAFYGTRRFITEFTRALHLYLNVIYPPKARAICYDVRSHQTATRAGSIQPTWRSGGYMVMLWPAGATQRRIVCRSVPHTAGKTNATATLHLHTPPSVLHRVPRENRRFGGTYSHHHPQNGNR